MKGTRILTGCVASLKPTHVFSVPRLNVRQQVKGRFKAVIYALCQTVCSDHGALASRCVAPQKRRLANDYTASRNPVCALAASRCVAMKKSIPAIDCIASNPPGIFAARCLKAFQCTGSRFKTVIAARRQASRPDCDASSTLRGVLR